MTGSEGKPYVIHHGDCLEYMAAMEPESVDAIVTDPPYGLEFMGKKWDKLDGRFVAPPHDGQWAAAHGASRKGFDGYGEMPSYVHSFSNIRCPDCGNWRDGRDPNKPDRRKGYKCVCGGAQREQRNQVAAKIQDWHTLWAIQALRVLKPGGHLLAFGAPRTYHRLACAIEDAGFEIRDSIHWEFSSGFPKSKSVSLSIDKGEGFPNRGKAIPTASRYQASDIEEKQKLTSNPVDEYVPKSEAAQAWQGWGTALKPAYEPIVVARKPLIGTVAQNVLAHGTGAINVDGCRVGTSKRIPGLPTTWQCKRNQIYEDFTHLSGTTSGFDPNCGRWPANVVLSHAPECKKVGTRQVRTETAVRQNLPPEGGSPGNIPIAPCKSRGPDVTYGDENGMETIEAWDCVPGCPVQSIDAQSGTIKGKVGMRNKGKYRFMGTERVHRTFDYGSDDIGGASRFFNTFAYDDEDFPVCIYTSKAARSERDKGLNERNPHPTIKPIALMRHLVRLVTPPGGLVLDPFAGSGTTLIAATLENMRSIGIEIDEDYIGIINQRLDAWQPIQGDLGLAI